MSKELELKFNDWITKTNEKEKYEDLSFFRLRKIKKELNNSNFILNKDFKSVIALGENNINKYTFRKFLKTLNLFLEEKKLVKNYLITFSNFPSKEELFFLEEFEKIEINKLFSTKNNLSSIGLNSLITKNEEISLSIHIENNENFVRILILDKDGKEINLTDSNSLIRMYQKEEMIFSDSLIEKKEIEIVDNKYFLKYQEQLKNSFFSINRINQINENKVLINLNSDFNNICFKDLFSQKFNNNLFLFFKKSSDLIESTKSFSHAYKFANRKKIEHIINLSPSGDQLSFASKQGIVWKFYKSSEIFLLLLNFVSNDLKNSNNFSIDVNNNKYFKSIAKKLKISILEKANLLTDNNYKFLFDDGETSVYDSLKIFKFLIFQAFSHFSVNEIIDKTFEEMGFLYSKHKELSIDFDINEFIKNNIETNNDENIKINKYKILSENNDYVFFELKTSVGIVSINYNKLTKYMNVFTFTYGEDKDNAFYNNRTFEKEILKTILNENKVNSFETRKGKIRLLLIFLVFIIMMVSIMLTMFDSQILSTTNMLLNSFDTIWFYILVTHLFLFVFFISLMHYILFKKIKKDTKFFIIYKSFILSWFIRNISPSYFFGVGAQLWYLRKKGYHSNEITPVILLYSVSFGLITLVLNFGLLSWSTFVIYNNFLNMSYSQNSIYILFMWIGFVWMSFNVLFYFFISFFKKIHNFTFAVIERLLFLLGLEKKYIKINDELEFNSSKIRKNLKKFSSQKVTMVSLIFITLLSYAYNGLITQASFNVVLLENNVSNAPYLNTFDFIAMNTTINFINLISPIPGSSGTTETVMFNVYSSYISTKSSIDLSITNDYAKQISLLNRSFSYYLIVLLAAIPSFAIILKNSQKRP